jgi:hypothetical protein
MDKKIVKVIYTNGEIDEVKDWKTTSEIKTEFNYSLALDWKAQRHFERQFYKIERDVLWNMNDNEVKKYAKDHLDLKDEDDNDCDCDEKDICDYEDDEIMTELSRRKLFGYTNVNIISVDLFTRFSRLITVANNQELEKIILELETKHNL